ncbi:Polyketide cyclase/dehydrase and lipid transport superfamily protein [Arabidopsis thaliana]|uniref:Polyketide cyclase/dehydrase and lipid transport superfamily protein n=1 Tax=Arabidopsis thaliana TaxID=3702 RepID=F4I6Z0_ARATH|nr:Polyketide cyclase/dehydrase and lipid transport superfamily protein [Arabidopsis thaliana]AEE35132.1 Polyketide cyclase/dehydrase and lipid transport superfamily protein [Arabidopsis thaliana]|eukprot:NP_177243.1 Polyketide cyclase/dehydrase and lipid transport superfamily protein [Arabidopsis thaliana]
MAQMAKSMIEVEINVSADMIFGKSFSKLSSLLHEHIGDGCKGTKNWTLSVDGKVEKMKERVEIDEANKSMTVFVFEGDVMENYSSFTCNLQIIPKLHGRSIARWSWEYEKLNADSPAPNKYMDFAVYLTKDIESNLLKT